MKMFKFAAAAATGAAAMAAFGLPNAVASPDKDQKFAAVGLAGNGTLVVPFDFGPRANEATSRPVTGLSVDTALVGIDYRVQDGKLYGVGDRGGIYTVDPITGAATADPTRNRVTILPAAGPHAVDFNPAANALRILAADGTNIRVPFATANATAIADTPLTRPAVAPATGTVPATGLNGAAYTNNDLSATSATTLFDIDTERDQVTVQSPANSGTTAPTGSIGIDFGPNAGFDIQTSLDKDGRAKDNKAFAVNDSSVYQIDLLTGSASHPTRLPVSGVTDIALTLKK